MKIALIQTLASDSSEANLENHIQKIRQAASGGAKIICTQELFLSKYFCVNQEAEKFDLAEQIPGITTYVLCELAKELGVVIVASLFENRGNEVYHNTSVVIDADGQYLGKYRKMHIPQDPSFEEKFYFTQGDLGYKTFDTKFGKIGILICWDQWYPEAARLTALSGAQIIFYPTAIGVLESESQEDFEKFHNAWQTVQRGHAVANGVFVAAVNRIGTEGQGDKKITFWGNSFVANPYGQVVAQASKDKEEILYCEVDFEQSKEFRRTWPFFRDRRIETYGDITKRNIDSQD